MFQHSFLFVLLLSLIHRIDGYRDPLNDAMYQYHAYTACRTFFNTTGRVGCHTKKGGVVAPIYLAEDIESLPKLKNIKEKQILVTSSKSMSNGFVRAVQEYSPTGWIIVDSTNAPYTPLSFATPTKWNPNSSGLRWNDLNFPIVFVDNTTSSNDIIKKAQWNDKNNAHDQMNAQVARLDPYVGPKNMNASKCYDLKRCKPMGGYSIWSTLGEADDREKVLAVTQLDAISLGMGKAIGANAGASGIIALMAAAAVFNQSNDAINYKRQIAFAFFDGESFGHMGSQRFVRDLAQWSCKDSVKGPHGYNICTNSYGGGKTFSTRAAPSWYWVPETFSKMNKTKYVVALDQVGRRSTTNSKVGNSGGMYVHGGVVADAIADADYGLSGMPLHKSNGDGGDNSDKKNDLPPSSADAFVKGTHGMKNVKEKVSIVEEENVVVVTGYNRDVDEVNPYYQTAYDDLSNINAADLIKIATTVARSLYAMATVNNIEDSNEMKTAISSAGHLSADPLLVEKLINCTVISWNCDLTKDYIPWMIDIANGKSAGKINLSTDRRLQYLSPVNKKYIATPQAQVLREILAEVTTAPSEEGVSCNLAEGMVDENGTEVDTNYGVCKIAVTGYECIKRK